MTNESAIADVLVLILVAFVANKGTIFTAKQFIVGNPALFRHIASTYETKNQNKYVRLLGRAYPHMPILRLHAARYSTNGASLA